MPTAEQSSIGRVWIYSGGRVSAFDYECQQWIERGAYVPTGEPVEKERMAQALAAYVEQLDEWTADPSYGAEDREQFWGYNGAMSSWPPAWCRPEVHAAARAIGETLDLLAPSPAWMGLLVDRQVERERELFGVPTEPEYFNPPGSWMDRLEPGLLVRYWRRKGRPGILRCERYGVRCDVRATPSGELVVVNHLP